MRGSRTIWVASICSLNTQRLSTSAGLGEQLKTHRIFYSSHMLETTATDLGA